MTMSNETTARVTPVDLHRVDHTEVRQIEATLATYPPTSEVAHVLRDVLDGIRWASRETCHRSVEVTTSRTQKGI
jgi:hypothetical protein